MPRELNQVTPPTQSRVNKAATAAFAQLLAAREVCQAAGIAEDEDNVLRVAQLIATNYAGQIAAG